MGILDKEDLKPHQLAPRNPTPIPPGTSPRGPWPIKTGPSVKPAQPGQPRPTPTPTPVTPLKPGALDRIRDRIVTAAGGKKRPLPNPKPVPLTPKKPTLKEIEATIKRRQGQK